MISILVAAYNAVETLPQCLDSLCGQTYTQVEILCVDDHSTDGTLALLRQRAEADPRIHVIALEQNMGQAAARNIALHQATGDYIVMVDADDWLSLDCLERAAQVFQTHPATDCVVLQLTEVYDTCQHARPCPIGGQEVLSGLEAFEMCMDGWQLHGLYVARRHLYEQFPFDTTTRLYSDDNTSRLHYLHSREVRPCQGIYYYRKHPASMTNRFSLRRFDFMEANLSLLFALKKEAIRPTTLRRFEGERWYTFIKCYRMYLTHRGDIQNEDISSLQQRFNTILHTFRPSRLPRRYRWKPGYWLTLSLPLFDLQQRLYLALKR